MMKRLLKVFMLLALGLSILIPGLAWAYTQTFNDITLVKSTVDGWVDIVGSAHYDIKSTSVTWSGSNVTIAIHTNNNGTPDWNQDFIDDVAIDKNRDGIYETGIVIKTDNGGSGGSSRRDPMFVAGKVFTLAAPTNNGHWEKSDDYAWIGGGYGQSYDKSNNPIPGGTHVADPALVLLKPGSYPTFDGSVTWTQPSDYLVTITLAGINTDGSWNNFNFLWSSETCGNDAQYTTFTPIPATAMLMVTGLVGLAVLGRRKGKRV